MMNLKLVVLLIAAVTLTGCAGGRSYDYRLVPVDPHIVGNGNAVTLGVHDQREYVKNGEKFPQYVGTQRTPAYVPWNINTKSGSPMADDFLVNIKRALESDGYTVHDVSLSEKDDREQVLAKLEAVGDKRILLFTINEWYFDVWSTVRMEYSLNLDVLTDDGTVLAHVDTGKKMWDGKQNVVPDAEFKSAIEKLLSDVHVTLALYTSASPYTSPALQDIKTGDDPTTVKPEAGEQTISNSMPCTTDQVLKMKAMGMTDSRIKAACR